MKHSQPLIKFHFLVTCPVPERKKLKAFIVSLFKGEAHQLAELSYVFCDDAYLLNLNGKFLDHHYYTDILTFPFSDPASRIVSGEIYISVDRVRENAKDLGLPFQRELHRVIFHGALHLCHFKDKSKKDKAIMRSMGRQVPGQVFRESPITAGLFHVEHPTSYRYSFTIGSS